MKFDLKMKIKSLKSLKENKHLVAAFFLLIILSIYLSHASTTENIDEPVLQADTLIPKGFILYPIRLENMDAIRGVIDQYGVIDVYAGQQIGGKAKKLLSKVKILQAPYNPNEFAVLIPDYMSQKMISESGPFTGVIQNRSAKAEFSKPEIEQDTEQKTKKINIEYQKGS
jgi:hypothetical protein